MLDVVYLRTANELIQLVAEKHLTDSVHGFRPNRSVDTAFQRAKQGLTHAAYAAEVDIIAAYDNVNLDILRYIVHKRILQRQVRYIIDTVIGYRPTTGLGAPDGTLPYEASYHDHKLVQGYPTSPTLFNLYLMEVDEMMQITTDFTYAYTRYADNILIAAASMANLQRQLSHLYQMLEGLGMTTSNIVHNLNIENQFMWLGRTYYTKVT